MPVEKNMIFKNQEQRHTPSSEMLYGTYGVWHVGPNHNLNEKRDQITFEKSDTVGPSEKKMCSFMMAMMKKKGHHKEHKGHMGWHERKQWKSDMGHHEMNPREFQDMLEKIQQFREKQPKANFTIGTSFPHRYGFCKRIFSGGRRDLENERNTLPNLEPRATNIFYHV